MIKIGILSDTHISHCTETFKIQTAKAFSDCQIIIHAGDLVDHAILDVFGQKTVYAVHGNMCNTKTQCLLPFDRFIEIEGYALGICHGAGPVATIEQRLWDLFPEADCIIFGHTHKPLCERRGPVLFINPGSFKSSGAYGAPPTYAILDLDENGLQAKIHTL
jgi:uncharacterized protein